MNDEDNTMRTLSVYIEINGESEYVGEIVGTSSEDACFTYCKTESCPVEEDSCK